MKKCPFCGADIEDSAQFCLYCMRSLTEKEQIFPRKKKKLQWWVTIAAIVALVMIAVLLLSKMLNPSVEDPVLSSVPSESTTNSTSAHTKPSTQPTTEPTTQLHIHSYSVENTAIEYLKAEATCTTPAAYYYSCSCGKAGTDAFFHGELKEHTVVAYLGYPANCVSTGLTEGKRCSVCSTVFLSQTPIPVIAHTFDNDQDKTCNVCNYVRVIICRHPETVTLSAVSPTCASSGLTEGKKCALCDEILTAQTTIAPLEHTTVIDPAIAPTCITVGWNEGSHCSVCQQVIVAQKKVTATGHTFEKGDAPSACQVCGMMGTKTTQSLIIHFPDLPVVQNGTYKIVECSYRIIPLNIEGDCKWTVYVKVRSQNISDATVYPCYPELLLSGQKTGVHSLSSPGMSLAPGEYSLVEYSFRVDVPDGEYELQVPGLDTEDTIVTEQETLPASVL